MRALAFTLLVLSVPITRVAWAAPQQAAGASSSPVLADALSYVSTSYTPLVLAVAADNRHLLPTATEPPPSASLLRIALAYDCELQTFGQITAVAPRQATLLLSPAHAPNIYKDLPPRGAFQLLLSHLTAAQWHLLTGERGLGLSDLGSADLQNLFVASLPNRILRVAPLEDTGSPNWQKQTTHAAMMPRARLRLSRGVIFGLPMVNSQGETSGYITTDVPGRYLLDNSRENDRGSLYGQDTVVQAKNVLKAGDLDFRQSALSVRIETGGVKTVDDLIGRIRSQAGLEIYVDPHYGNKTITLRGAGSAAIARDLLQAVALCLTGTYRKVESAYVLTDDLAGVGARRQLWQEFCSEAEAGQEKMLTEAAARSSQVFAGQTLLESDSALALTPEQSRIGRTQPFLSGLDSAVLPISALTPAQQAEIKRILERGKQNPQNSQNRNVAVISNVRLELLLPDVDAPVTITLVSDFLQRAAEQARNEARRAAAPPSPTESVANLETLLQPFPRRAVLARVSDSAQVPALADVMKREGFHEMWLTFPAMEAADSGNTLKQAATQTQSAGIDLFAVLDLLSAGNNPQTSEALADRTLLGETSREANSRAGHRWLTTSESKRALSGEVLSPLLLSPSSEKVRASLARAMATVASVPGIRGIVLRDLAMTGYQQEYSILPLGYTRENRLRFLRKYQVDPIDITPAAIASLVSDTALPQFDDGPQKLIDSATSHDWTDFRKSLMNDFLRFTGDTVAVIRKDHALPVLVFQRRAPVGRNWYAEWNAPGGPLPDANAAKIHISNGAAALAKARWQSVLVQLPVAPEDLKDEVAVGRFLRDVQATVKGQPWDGLIWNISETPEEHGLTHLRALLHQAEASSNITPTAAK